MDKNRLMRKSFDLGSASLVFLVAFGAQLVFQLIVIALGLSDAAKTWTIVIGNQLVLLAVTLAFCFGKKVDFLEITGLRRPPRWYYFPLFILIAFACVATFAPLAGVFSHLLSKLGYDYNPTYYIPTESKGLFTLAFLALTLLPLLGEETAVRGVVMSGGRERSPLFAILYTALIFALTHGNLRQIVHQFLLGAVMGYLAYLTGGIYASGTVHLVNNGVALLFEYGFKNGAIDPRAYWYVAGELGTKSTLIGVVVGFFALAMLLVLITCLIHRDRSRTGDYIPSEEGKFGSRVTRYLRFLSAFPDEKERDRTDGKKGEITGGDARRDRSYGTVMAILLAAVLAAIVLLSLIPEA